MNRLLPARRRLTLHTKRSIAGYLFILPFILGFVVFMARPIFESLYMSFCDVSPKNFTKDWIGLANYDSALNFIPWFREVIVEQIGEMAVRSISTLVLSFVVAVVLNTKFHGRTLARVVFFLPVILSAGVLMGLDNVMADRKVADTMMVAMSENVANSGGIDLSTSIKTLLQTAGVATRAFQIVFDIIDGIYDVAISSGIQIIIFLSGMQTIPSSLYEAADVEGCSAWESFWMITFPMVSPLLLVNIIYSLVDYATRSDNRMMEKVLEVMYSKYDFGQASAIAWMYLLIAMGMMGIAAIIIRKGVKNYE